MKNIAAIFVIFSSTVLHKCLCFPNGAPDSQCESMIPGHGVDGQTVPSPYEVTVENTYYAPGEIVTLSIESNSSDIKGFLIQARKVGESSVIGWFPTLPANTKYVNCSSNEKGAITHNERLNVMKIDFEWQAPNDLYGNISFYATVVKDRFTFWVKLQSPELHMKVNTTTEPTPPPIYMTTQAAEDIIIYEDCVEAQANTCRDSLNGVYNIKARTEQGYAPLTCLNGNVLEGCPGNGWTIVGNVVSSPNSPATGYHSNAWTTKSTSYGFTPAFWSANVSEVCVYSPGIVAVVIPVQAPSLRSLFFGTTTVDMDKSDFEFNSTSAVNFYGDCYEVGFNVGDPGFMKLRMGIVAVRSKPGCDMVTPNAIGLGIFDVGQPIPGSAHGFIANNTREVDSGISYFIAVRVGV